MSIQQLMLGVGAKKKTYMDDIFSTYLWKGDGNSGRTITNNIDVSGEGALVWMKSRSTGHVNVLFDTERGANQRLRSDSNLAQNNTDTLQPSFTSSGFTVGSGNEVNGSGNDYTSWTFRKAPGFCDVVTISLSSYSTNQRISHSLGCIPGLILLKNANNTEDWRVYHRELGRSKYLTLNGTGAATTSTDAWGTADPTSTDFGFNTTNLSVGMPSTYVAYLFAGGESTAATARSVEFGGSSDWLVAGSSSDLTMGTGDFTAECYVKFKTNPSGHQGIFQVTSESDGNQSSNHNDAFGVGYTGSAWRIYAGGGSGAVSAATASPVGAGQWYHVALVRASGVTKLYLDGNPIISKTDTHNYDGTYMGIGVKYGPSFALNGFISNVRVVKGTAVYTAPFKPSRVPLTNITNTKLLCCNNSSTTGKTVGPTITESGDSITASTDSPFDDPAAFKFGENGDQEIIKCGSYTTDSNEDAIIDLGWEPQWVLVKRTDSSAGGDWLIYDSMRGFMNAQDIEANNDGSKSLSPHLTDTENDNSRLGLTSTGFYADQYGANRSFIYMALRRSDGYVGKPAEAGTDAFAMDTGNDSSTIPNYDSGFPVDFAFKRYIATSNNWQTSARLIQGKYLDLNDGDAEGTSSGEQYDSNVGYNTDQSPSTVQAWMFKRHAGFTVCAYKGNGVGGRKIVHDMNKTPEMIWIKNRSSTNDWAVWHSGLSSTSHYLKLNSTNAEANGGTAILNNTAPTSSVVTIGHTTDTNGNNDQYLMMLFSSVDGISKCGSFTGSSSDVTITTGFQPRFVIIKNIGLTYPWMVLDSVRGWGTSDDSGDDPYLRLNQTDAQVNFDNGYRTSTGFVVDAGSAFVNNNGWTYIYYAHA